MVLKSNAAVPPCKSRFWNIPFVIDAIVQHLGKVPCSYYDLLYPKLQVAVRVVPEAVVPGAANTIFSIHFCNAFGNVSPAITATDVQVFELMSIMVFWVLSPIVVSAAGTWLAPARTSRRSVPVPLPVDINPPAEETECCFT